MSTSATAQSFVTHPHNLFIDGAWTKPATNRLLTVISPVTEEPVATFAEATEADVDRAVAAARAAFDQGPWPRMTADERAALRHAGVLADLSGTFLDAAGTPLTMPQARRVIGISAAQLAAVPDVICLAYGRERAPAVRAAVRGQPDAEAHRFVAARPLVEWAELWHALGRQRDETERFYLDKRHAIVSGLASLNGP